MGLMRAALMAVASPLYRLSEFYDGLLRVDNVLDPQPESTLVDPRRLAIWLRRVIEAWESACMEFPQAKLRLELSKYAEGTEI